MSEFSVHVPGHPPFRLALQRPELTLGRAPDQDIVIEDATLSRRHAKLTWENGTVWIEDLGSRHGCFKNGKRIHARTQVAPGDGIRLGRLEVRLEPLDAPSNPAPEETPLSLSMQDLRLWSGSDDTLGRLSNWREALDILHHLSLAMLRDLEPEELLGGLLDHLFTFLGATRGAVLYKGSDGNLAPLAVRARDATQEGPLNLSPSTLEATLTRRAATLFKEPLFPGNEGQNGRLAESNTTSVMAVPLEHDGQVLGLFYFDAAMQRDPFTEPDLRFVASLSNLAAAKLLQQRLAAELRLKAEQERELKAREKEAQAKGEFLAQVSHEIRTPMNAVLGFTHLAQQEPLTLRAADCLRKIDSSGRALMGIVNDILDFSKLGAGMLALEAIPFQLREVMENLQDTFAQAAEEKGLGLDIPQGGSDWLLGDPLRLGQVLANLLGNALKFTSQGRVELHMEPQDEEEGQARLRFSVRDTGPGIPPSQAAELFTPYRQGDASISRRYGGTGLGLAISKRLVADMGGVLQVESGPGPGSTFHFTLSLPRTAPRAPAPLPAPVPNLRGCHILLVEDHPLNQELARALLDETGARVDVAGSGAEALEKMNAGSYSAILMDLHMPGMDGFEAARKIRARGHTLPILAMTAQAGPRDLCLQAGMDEVIPKPVAPAFLFETLARFVHADLATLAPVMDAPAALARLGGRRDLLLRFLAAFLDDPVDPAGIAEAMARDEPAAALRLAHDLKGIALGLGLTALAAAASALEDHLAETPEGWETAYVRLQEAYGRFLECAAPFQKPGPH